MTSHALHEHLPDDVLVRLLDGDGEATEHAGLAGLAGCGECRARAEQLRRRSDRLRELLVDGDWQVPDTRAARAAAERAHARRQARRARWHRARRAAAAVVLLIAVGLTVSPARAWVVRTAAGLWSAVRGAAPADESAGPADSPLESVRTVEFVPAAGELTLQFLASGSGSLALGAAAGERLVVEVEGEAAPDVLLLERTVRVDNRDAPAAVYRILVPAQVTAVRVRIGDAEPTLYPRAELVTGGAGPRPLR